MTITSATARPVRVSAMILATVAGLAALPAPPARASEPSATLDSTSRYDAGYTADLATGRNHRVTTGFAVPALDCTAPQDTPVTVAVGLTGRATGTAGSAGVTVFLVVVCTDGGVEYSGFVATSQVGVGRRLEVTPGQVLTVAAGVTADRGAATLSDASGEVLVRGASPGFRADHVRISVQSRAEPRLGRVAPVTFTGATIDAAPLAAAAPTRVRQVDAAGTVLATPTPLSGAGGDFRVRFVLRP